MNLSSVYKVGVFYKIGWNWYFKRHYKSRGINSNTSRTPMSPLLGQSGNLMKNFTHSLKEQMLQDQGQCSNGSAIEVIVKSSVRVKCKI